MALVTGDPASMRAAAAQLRIRAETLGGIAATVEARVAGMAYTGGAADRFREGTATANGALRGLVVRMHGTADTLTRQAAVVEEQLLRAAQQGYPS